MANWTVRETVHLNSGGAFWKGEIPTSLTQYDVLRDGEKTGIVREMRTENGRKAEDILRAGDQELDLMKTDTADVHQWCEAWYRDSRLMRREIK